MPPLLPTQQVVVLPDSSPTATLRALLVIVSDVRPQDAGNPPDPLPSFPAPFTDPRSAVCHDVTLYTFRPNLDLQGRRGGMGDRDSEVGWGGGVTLD